MLISARVTVCVVLLWATLCSAEHSGPNFTGRRTALNGNAPFRIQWRDNPPAGYRIATYAEFRSTQFEDAYNSEKGIPYDTRDPTIEGGACGLAVKEGWLFYPLSDPTSASDCTLSTEDFQSSCSADEQYGSNGMIATMGPCGNNIATYFIPPVNRFQFTDFGVNATTCEFKEGGNRYTVYILDRSQPSPSPSPTPTPSPSPTPTPSPSPTPTPDYFPAPNYYYPAPTPTPTSLGQYICCGYYDFAHHLESDFCVDPAQECPIIFGFTSLGNYTVGDCSECCQSRV